MSALSAEPATSSTAVETHEIVIVGAGPGGLSAAVHAQKSHLDYVAAVMARVKEGASRNKGYRCTHAPEVLGHFFSRFEPID